MNKETQELLQQLATKLGTTAEYLWQVLLVQARIDAITTLFQFLLIIIYGIILFKLHKKFSAEIPNDNYNDNLYEKHDLLHIPMLLGGLIFVILAILGFLCISDVVNGFLNPEYWALDKILNRCK